MIVITDAASLGKDGVFLAASVAPLSWNRKALEGAAWLMGPLEMGRSMNHPWLNGTA